MFSVVDDFRLACGESGQEVGQFRLAAVGIVGHRGQRGEQVMGARRADAAVFLHVKEPLHGLRVGEAVLEFVDGGPADG